MHTNRSARWLLPALIVGLTGQAAIFGLRPIMSYRAIDLGAGALELGILAASFALVPVFLAMPLGRHIDRRGGRNAAIIGSAICFIGTGLLLFSDSLFVLIMLNAVIGSSQLAMTLSTQWLIGSSSASQSRNRSFAQFSLATSIGHIVGPALATSIGAGAESLALNFYVGAFLFCTICHLIACLATFFFPATTTQSSADRSKLHSLREIIAVPGMKTSSFASLITLATLDLFMVYLPLWAVDKGVSEVVVGGLLALRGAGSLVSRTFLPLLLKHRSHAFVAAISTLVSALAVGALAFADLWIATAASLSLGLALGIMQPLTMAWVVNLAPPGTIAAALSIRLLGNRAGQILIPLGVAPLGTVMARPADLVFLISGALLLASSAASGYLARTAPPSGKDYI
ncbi:MAG: MFS transporter [Cryobacterium sp.]|nr:MFS transporter [Cryobacterium sp.]